MKAKHFVGKALPLILIVCIMVALVPSINISPVNAGKKTGKKETEKETEKEKEPKPSTPKISLEKGADGASIHVIISPAEGADGFYIYMKRDSEDTFRRIKKLKKDGSKERTYKVKNLEAGKYMFRVMAYSESIVDPEEDVITDDEEEITEDSSFSEIKSMDLSTVTTVKKANKYDYSVTISESGDMLSAEEIGKLIKKYGKYTGTPGMPADKYKAAMKYKWKDVSLEKNEQAKAEVSLSKKYSYNDLVSIMETLSSYTGVSLYRIGKSTSGKNMYALDVDLTNCALEDKHTVLLTGQVHARETAGPVFILKELTDILNAYKKGDKKAKGTLKNTRFVTVACVNPDGHDGIAFDVKHWTYKGGQLWKATSDGTDINRNFPGFSWMQLGKGVKETPYKSSSPDKIFYFGDYAGCSSEVRAMMKFYQFFVGVEHAEILVDYHMQGRISYAGKGYAPKYNNDLSEELRKACHETQKKGRLGKKYNFDNEDNEEDYGLHGSGSTNTDYAWAVAMGGMFSTKFGFSVYTDREGNEYPLIMIPQHDKASVEVNEMRSPEFRSLSWEIGSGKSYLGYSSDTRILIEKEYYNYNFDEMLYTYAEVLNK